MSILDPYPAREIDIRRRVKVENRTMPIGVGIFLIGGAVLATVVNFLADGGQSPLPPTIPVPAWPFWIIAFAPLYSILASWRLLDSAYRWHLFTMWVYSGTVFTVFPINFAGAYPDPSGILVNGKHLGWHWLASPVGALAFLLITIRFLTLRKSCAPVQKSRKPVFDFKTKEGREFAIRESERVLQLTKTKAGMAQYLEELRLEAAQREKDDAAETEELRQDAKPHD